MDKLALYDLYLQINIQMNNMYFGARAEHRIV